jgi:hypothetical protein
MSNFTTSQSIQLQRNALQAEIVRLNTVAHESPEVKERKLTAVKNQFKILEKKVLKSHLH